MKKMLFLAAGFAALLMTACGGEKTDEKKEEKKPISDETKAVFDALSTDWSNIDGMFAGIGGALDGYDRDAQTKYLDSMKTVAEKAKPEIKTQALSLIDSLEALNFQAGDWKTTLEGERATWGTITEDFTKVKTEIEKGEADGEKVAARAEGFTEQFNYKKEALLGILTNWEKIQKHDAALKALFTPVAK